MSNVPVHYPVERQIVICDVLDSSKHLLRQYDTPVSE